MAAQYRYSVTAFQRSVVTAIGLTLIVSFLVWLFARLFGFRHADIITLISGLVFFSFCSAAMIVRYFRRDVILAIRPTGLFDARFSSEAVDWDDIKELRLTRAENEFQLGVYLWPGTGNARGGSSSFQVELGSLDAPVESILQAFAPYKEIMVERAE